MNQGVARRSQHVQDLTLTALAGAMLAGQARVNASLSEQMGGGTAHAVIAAAVSFSVGTIFLVAAVLAVGAWRDAFVRGRPRLWECIGGLGGASLVASSAAAVPAVGVALLAVMIVAGQTSGALVVDRIGFGPGGYRPLTPARALGAALAVAGLALAAIGAPRGQLTIPLLFAVVGSGFLVAAQQAVNGRLREHTGSALIAALISFAGGTLVLLLAWAGMVAAGSVHGLPWPHNPWLYLGGIGGAIYITMSAATIKRLGVLQFSLASIGGQLLGGVVLDLTAPTGHLRPGAIAAVILTIVAVAISAAPANADRTP